MNMEMENFNIAPRKKIPVNIEKAKQTYEREQAIRETEEALKKAFENLSEEEVEEIFEKIKKSRKFPEYEAPEVKKENPVAEKLAKQIFGILEQYAGYKKEGANTERILDQINREIDLIQDRKRTIITKETFEKVEDIVSREFSKKGGNDATVSHIMDLLSEIEERRNYYKVKR